MSENYGLGFRGFSIRLSRLIVIVVVKAFTCLCTEKLQPNLHTVDDTLIMQPTNYFQTNGSFKFACLLLFRWAVLLFFFCLGWARVGYSLEFEIIFGTRRIRRSTTGFSVVWWTHTSIGFPEWMHRCNHLRTLPQNITKIRSAMSFLLSLHRFRHPFRAFSLSRSETIGLICHFRTRMFLYLFSLFVSDGKKRIIG